MAPTMRADGSAFLLFFFFFSFFSYDHAGRADTKGKCSQHSHVYQPRMKVGGVSILTTINQILVLASLLHSVYHSGWTFFRGQLSCAATARA